MKKKKSFLLHRQTITDNVTLFGRYVYVARRNLYDTELTGEHVLVREYTTTQRERESVTASLIRVIVRINVYVATMIGNSLSDHLYDSKIREQRARDSTLKSRLLALSVQIKDYIWHRARTRVDFHRRHREKYRRSYLLGHGIANRSN